MNEPQFKILTFGEMAHLTIEELDQLDDKLWDMRKDIKTLIEYKKRLMTATFTTVNLS